MINQTAILQIIKMIIDTIREAGGAGVPSGHIYAALMTQGCTLSQYQAIERIILSTGLITKSGDRLKWKEQK